MTSGDVSKPMHQDLTNTSKKSKAIRFEEEIKSFMARLGFENVDGAKDTFLINGIQVDVCGGHEDTLLVVECTMTQELKKKSIREKIKEFRGVTSSLEKGFKSSPIYKKYKFTKYMLATKNIGIRKEDIIFANESPRIYIWDDNFIAYYEDLYDKINWHSKFNLLGEIGVKPAQQNTISIPAFLSTFGKIKMYNFMIDPRDLLEVSYVARRELKNERFYQRIIKKERLTEIAKYVSANNILANNLILSFGEHIRKSIKFHILTDNYIGQCTSGFGIKYGILEFPRDYRSCWIIDGQHRLYAFVNTTKMLFNMPVTAFENLDIEKQCKLFLDINKNQKPVPPDLVWDLNGDMIPSEEDGIISNVVKSLNDIGPLFHKIYIPSTGIKKRSGLLRMAGICLSIKRTKLVRNNTASKTANPFYDSDPNKIVKNLSTSLTKYFSCVQKLMPEDWKLDNKGFVLDDGGNSVMIRLFEKVVSRCVMKEKPDEEDFEKYLKPLTDIFSKQYQEKEKLKKLKLSITSEGGKDEVLKKFILYIREGTGDHSFGGEIESVTSKELKELERKIKELIRLVLSKNGGEEDWFEKKVPPDIYKRALKNLEKRAEGDIKKAYLQLTLGECMTILRQNKLLFYPLFRKSEQGFGSDSELEGAFDFITRIRTKMVHYVGEEGKTHDDTLFKIYIEKLNKCVEPILSL